MTDYQIDIPGHKLIIGDRQIPIPDGLMDPKAFTKNGAIEGRSHAGKALRGWVEEQLDLIRFAPEGADAPADSDLTVSSDDLPLKTELPPAAPKMASSPMPRLGSHDSAKHLVNLIAELYPDAKRNDWRRVQAMLGAAQRYGSHWASLRKPGT